MTHDEQAQAIVSFGFTARQAGFLAAVIRHAGVCLARQYCAYAGIVRGQKTHDFFGTLVAQRSPPRTVAGLGRRASITCTSRACTAPSASPMRDFASRWRWRGPSSA